MLSHFSCVQLCVTLLTVAYQAPQSLGFSRQEYWSGLPCLPPGYLPNPEVEPASLMSPARAGGFFTTSTTWEAHKEGRVLKSLCFWIGGAGEDSWESLGQQGDQTSEETNLKYSSVRLMLKLKLQYFGHLMWRANSLKKTLMLGKTEGKRRGQQRMR